MSRRVTAVKLQHIAIASCVHRRRESTCAFRIDDPRGVTL